MTLNQNPNSIKLNPISQNDGFSMNFIEKPPRTRFESSKRYYKQNQIAQSSLKLVNKYTSSDAGLKFSKSNTNGTKRNSTKT